MCASNLLPRKTKPALIKTRKNKKNQKVLFVKLLTHISMTEKMELQEKEQPHGSFVTDRRKNLIAHVAIYLLLSCIRMVLIKML